MSNNAKIALTGRISTEPKQNNWQGTTVVSFNMAVNTPKKDGDNYVSDFYSVSVWGKSGEYILPKIKKGDFVQVYGDFMIQPYQDKKTGETRQSLSVRAIDVLPMTFFIEKTLEKDNANNSVNDGPPPF